ncbi:hypothetical protein [Aureliella helgolandensis]|uniref:Curli production assembly/transport component CsgG n=1 Tax=Aureliella helgolandensis TaxID=2527968 RepID=A0A518G698_9BACT|nr:hypothetical protein [Aureliella helgolandensis]QDV24118.1 hypothetical protein Q31a_24310 [Aureliella helgolandensis]
MQRQQRLLAVLAILTLVPMASGCISLAANLIGAVQGTDRPAEYTGLKGKRVAVIVATDSGIGADTASAMLASYIQANLKNNVKDIDLVRQSEVERWVSSRGQTDGSYLDIGKGVKAEQVVAVEVTNLGLRNGATLYKGHADLVVSVLDITDEGEIMYRKHLPEFTFPKMGGPSVTDTTESKFRGLFLTVVAEKVSGLFYPVDPTAEVALDATANSF